MKNIDYNKAKFTFSITEEQQKANEQGIEITMAHLRKSFLNESENSEMKNNNINKQRNNRKRTPPPILDGRPITKLKTNNSTLLLPFDNDDDDNNIQQILNQNLKQLNNINNQMHKLPSITMAYDIQNKFILRFLKQYKIYRKNIYELVCIEYKIGMHLKSNFIPKQERLRIKLHDFRVKLKSQQNYQYIENTLNESMKISFNNYLLKYKQKQEKKQFYINAIKTLKTEFDKNVKERRYRYYHNVGNMFPNTNIKNSIVHDFDAEVNKLYKILMDIDEHYENEFDRFKSKILPQFYRLCEKIKCGFNTNNNNYDIIFNYIQDLDEVKKEKELNKLKYWNDNNKKQNEEEQKMNEDENDNNTTNFIFDPMAMVIPQINYVNIDNKHRKLIVNKYGNKYDKYAQKMYEKSIKYQKDNKQRKNNNNNYYGNKNKNKNRNNKYNKYSHF